MATDAGIKISQQISIEESSVENELELLQAIYVHEIQVQNNESGRPCVIEILLHPATADDPEKQYVRVTLSFILPLDYPKDPPLIELRNARGLSDEEFVKLHKLMRESAEERQGSPMMYELIEIAKEVLTDSNIPHCPCVVCLERFHDSDDFTKTECWHYFHRACLATYIQHSLKEIKEAEQIPNPAYQEEKEKFVVCPVCREVINSDRTDLGTVMSWDDKSTFKFKLDEDLKMLQKKMSEMLEYQKSKGGLIDIEAEQNRFSLPAEGFVIPAEVAEKIKKAEKEKSSKGRGRPPESYYHKYAYGSDDRHRKSSSRKSGNYDNRGRDKRYEKKDYQDRNGSGNDKLKEKEVLDDSGQCSPREAKTDQALPKRGRGRGRSGRGKCLDRDIEYVNGDIERREKSDLVNGVDDAKLENKDRTNRRGASNRFDNQTPDLYNDLTKSYDKIKQSNVVNSQSCDVERNGRLINDSASANRADPGGTNYNRPDSSGKKYHRPDSGSNNYQHHRPRGRGRGRRGGYRGNTGQAPGEKDLPRNQIYEQSNDGFS